MAEYGVGTHNPFEALRQKKDKGDKAGKEDSPKPAAAASAAAAPQPKRVATNNKRGGTASKGRRGEGAAPHGAGKAVGATDARGKRVFDRKSGAGRVPTTHKGGHGKGNWGSALEDDQVGAEDGEAEAQETPADGAAVAAAAPADGAAAPADAAAAAPAEPAKPAEPEDTSMTLDEFFAKKKQVAEDAKLKPRQVDIDDKQWRNVKELKSAEQEAKEKEEAEAKEREKERKNKSKSKKVISLDEFVGPASPSSASPTSSGPASPDARSPSSGPRRGGDRRGGRGGRGGDRGGSRGRGGRGRGGRGRGGYGGQGPNVLDESSFPKLGAKA